MTGPEATRGAVLKFALTLPGAWEDHPWEEDVVKVGKKIRVATKTMIKELDARGAGSRR